jgi:hypothetical protein
MDKKTKEACQRIVIYLAQDEAKHWVEMGKPKEHIYKDVLTLAEYLDESLEFDAVETEIKERKICSEKGCKNVLTENDWTDKCWWHEKRTAPLKKK